MRVERIDEYRWRVPREGGMRTEGLIFADAELMRDLEGDQSVQQVANVAHLPGIVGPAIAMPDIHWGYGFPIGGVAAFDEEEGVVSPGGVGYDINCGVRLLVAPLGIADVRPRLAQLVDALFATIPSGVGASRSDVKLGRRDLERVLSQGARWAVEQGYGFPGDLEAIEVNGELPAADPDAVSERAKERGKSQLGTVGSGNHFVEVGYVAETFDPAERRGLVYAGCRNSAKHATHEVGGRSRRLWVPRKGATRAFPPGHAELAPQFRDIGQPVLIPGDMGRYSYVLVGTAGAFRETFGSSCHGAGRRLSRHKAEELARPRNIPKELEARGIVVRAATRATVDEEMPEAYKDVARVVDVVHAAGIGRKVAQLRPVGVVKG